MSRVGQVKASDGERLTDRIAIGLLTSTFPPSLVGEVLEASNRVEQRHRLLPARVVFYFAVRSLINGATEPEELDPDRASFIASLRVVRRLSLTSQPFPPERLAQALAETATEPRRRLSKRRLLIASARWPLISRGW